MITRLIFRLTMLVFLLTTISVGVSAWVGTRLPMKIYAYNTFEGEYSYIHIADTYHEWHLTLGLTDDILYFDWSPDGDSIIVGRGFIEGRFWCSYHLHDGLDCSDIRRLQGKRGVFSPNSRYFAAIEYETDLKVWDRQTHQTHTLHTCEWCSDAIVWLPDNQHLIFGDGSQIIQIDILTGDTEIIDGTRLYTGSIAAHDYYIAYKKQDDTALSIVMLDMTTRQIIQSVDFPLDTDIYEILWSPDGTKLLIRYDNHLTITTLDHHVTTWELDTDIIVWAGDSEHIYYACPEGLCLIDVETGESTLEMTLEDYWLSLWNEGTIAVYPYYSESPSMIVLIEDDDITVIDAPSHDFYRYIAFR